MLSVMVTWGKRRSHKYKDKRGSKVHRAELKWLLNVLNACSVEFIRCMCRGTSWNGISYSSK